MSDLVLVETGRSCCVLGNQPREEVIDMEDNKKWIITKLNSTVVSGMIMVVIVGIAAGVVICINHIADGIAACVKHVINPGLFE